MSGRPNSTTIVRSVAQSVVVLLVVAVVARIVWELLAPLLPALGVLLIFIAIGALLLGGPRSRGGFH